jgi:hypothetical protein
LFIETKISDIRKLKFCRPVWDERSLLSSLWSQELNELSLVPHRFTNFEFSNVRCFRLNKQNLLNQVKLAIDSNYCIFNKIHSYLLGKALWGQNSKKFIIKWGMKNRLRPVSSKSEDSKLIVCYLLDLLFQFGAFLGIV